MSENRCHSEYVVLTRFSLSLLNCSKMYYNQVIVHKLHSFSISNEENQIALPEITEENDHKSIAVL